MQYPHVVRHAKPVLPPVIANMRRLSELQGNRVSFSDDRHASIMPTYSHKRALMAMIIEMANIGRRFGHVMQLRLGHITFERCVFPQAASSVSPPTWYLIAHVRFVTNKSDGGMFQSVHLNSCRYTGSEPDDTLNTMFQGDIVLQLHHYMFMLNAFVHSVWSEALRCPALQPACLELPLFRKLDTTTGTPTYEAVPTHTARWHFCCCAYAAGYRGLTPHGGLVSLMQMHNYKYCASMFY
jgi:hypothetical protein